MKFKYSQFEGPKGEKIHRPTLPIMFKNGKHFIQVEGLIDTGADFTILPIEMAGFLKLKLDRRKKRIFEGAGSNPFTVYPSQQKIDHLIRQAGFRTISIKSEVYFAESQPIILLGNKGFLDKLRLVLDGKRKELEIL